LDSRLAWGLFGKLNNGIIYDDNLLSAVAMGVMTSIGRSVASILAGAVVMVSADSQKPERWASIIALLYVIEAPVHYGPYNIAPTTWDHLTRGVDLVFPGMRASWLWHSSLTFDTRKPGPDKSGGLNGSTQHLLKAFLFEPRLLISYTELNSNKTKALFRF